jgi:hypothetical protein
MKSTYLSFLIALTCPTYPGFDLGVRDNTAICLVNQAGGLPTSQVNRLLRVIPVLEAIALVSLERPRMTSSCSSYETSI